MNLEMKLETKRLIMRPVVSDDKYEIFEYRRDKEANKYQAWIPETVQDVDVFIAQTSEQMNVPGTWFQLVLIEKERNKVIGDLGIHFMDNENKQAELGFTIHKDFQNKGYATEAVSKVIDFLFEALNKHRIIASIDPDNENSLRLVERIGFRKEAHFIESLWIEDKWVDDVIYALIEKDWAKIKSL